MFIIRNKSTLRHDMCMLQVYPIYFIAGKFPFGLKCVTIFLDKLKIYQ